MKRDTMIFSVRLESGDYESSVRVPLSLDPAEQKVIVSQWLELMATGLRIGATMINADLADPQKSPPP